MFFFYLIHLNYKLFFFLSENRMNYEHKLSIQLLTFGVFIELTLFFQMECLDIGTLFGAHQEVQEQLVHLMCKFLYLLIS